MTKFSERVRVALDEPQISVSNWRTLISLLVGWLGAAGLADNVIEWKAWFEFGVMNHWREVRGFFIETLYEYFFIYIYEWLVDYIVLSVAFFRITGTFSLLNFYWFKDIHWIWALLLFPLQLFITSLIVIGWPVFFILLLIRAMSHALIQRGEEVSKFSRIIVSRTIWFCISFLLFLFICSDIVEKIRG